MKYKNIIIGALLGIYCGALAVFLYQDMSDAAVGGDGTIFQLQQWSNDGTNITQTVPSTPIKITGLVNCNTIDSDANGVLSCGSDEGGVGASAIAFDIDGTEESADISRLDFDGTDFTITESPADDFDITIAAAIARDSELHDSVTLAGSFDYLTLSGQEITLGSITPDDVFATGQTDEYCLTYEVTGDTWEWQECGSGGGLATTDIDTESELEAILTNVTNLFTNNDGALSDDDLSNNDTDDLSEGITNLYFTSARAITALTGQNISIFTNNSGYITDGNTGWDNSYGFITSADDTVSGTELDGVFSTTGLLKRTGAATYTTITDNSTNWDTAYSWGNHASAGYLTTVDISDNTNLAAGTGLTLTGDTLSADLGTAIDTSEITDDTITHADIADSDQTTTMCIYIEDPTADDDLKSIWANKTANDFLLTELWAESDQTVNLDLQVDDGTPADVNGTDITPAAGEAEDTSLSGDTTLAAGEELDLIITSVSGTPTWVSICWTGQWSD